MSAIFLSYARKDGQPAAIRLRSELERAGLEVWRDIEDMQGGQSWKDQLRKALRTVDTVVVLLTPASVTSKYVEWEWENALTLEKQVIPLLLLPCEVPAELKRRHYHNLSNEQDYVIGFAALMRDLFSRSDATNSLFLGESSQPSTANNRSIAVGGHADNSTFVTGDGNVVGANNSTTQQSGKYNIKIDGAERINIGDTFNG